MEITGKLSFFLVQIDDAFVLGLVILELWFVDIAEADGMFDSPNFGFQFVLLICCFIVYRLKFFDFFLDQFGKSGRLVEFLPVLNWVDGTCMMV